MSVCAHGQLPGVTDRTSETFVRVEFERTGEGIRQYLHAYEIHQCPDCGAYITLAQESTPVVNTWRLNDE